MTQPDLQPSFELKWQMMSRFKGPYKSPGFLLWQVSQSWRRSIVRELKKHGLTHTQFVVLASLGWLLRGNMPITQKRLGRFAGIDLNTVSQVVRSLEKLGHVKRPPRPGDDRSKFPELTPKGMRKIADTIPVVEALDFSFFSPSKGEEGTEMGKALQAFFLTHIFKTT